ncbi:hypothetical protein OG259_37165 [Streptomyces sp. NBC_00250]|uniref:hypothetical protein n=1 Tax=Streptomyces sp. NBC_00250 TaxID=2903641 RepID=UPI002E29CA56|nr:hypothetical protein [Streptomyces sp. NBC_00250]
MARTAHHIPGSRRWPANETAPGGPWRSLVLRDLRYSAACLSEATHGGSRPRPRAIRRSVAVYRWPRFNRDADVARWSAQQERGARMRLRTQAGLLLRLVNTPDGVLTLSAAETVDVPPARHRHGSLWFA